MKKYRIRFHLGQGENYRKWQVKTPSGDTVYHTPETTTLILHNARLINSKVTAQKITDGGHKKVCAWIECDNIQVSKPLSSKKSYNNPVLYNPRITPHWVHNGVDVDCKTYGVLITEGRNIHSMGN